MGTYSRNLPTRLRVGQTHITGLERCIADAIRREPENEPKVIVREDASDPSVQTIEGFPAALAHQYYSTSPADKLAAMYNAVSVLLMQHIHICTLHNCAHPHPSHTRVLVDLSSLLDDMSKRRNHPLVAYAAKAGRQGKTKDPRWKVEARSALGTAAEVRFRLMERYGSQGEDRTIKEACRWVVNSVGDRLSRIGLSIDVLMRRGEWSRITPERKDQAAPPAQREDRVEGWRRDALNAGDWKKYLGRLSGAEQGLYEEYCEILTVMAVERIAANAIDT